MGATKYFPSNENIVYDARAHHVNAHTLYELNAYTFDVIARKKRLLIQKLSPSQFRRDTLHISIFRTNCIERDELRKRARKQLQCVITTIFNNSRKFHSDNPTW